MPSVGKILRVKGEERCIWKPKHIVCETGQTNHEKVRTAISRLQSKTTKLRDPAAHQTGYSDIVVTKFGLVQKTSFLESQYILTNHKKEDRTIYASYHGISLFNLKDQRSPTTNWLDFIRLALDLRLFSSTHLFAEPVCASSCHHLVFPKLCKLTRSKT